MVGSPRSNTSIILQWQSPNPSQWNGPLLGYVVRYKPSGYPDSTLSFNNITSYTASVIYELDGLIIFQEYEIGVAAYNQMGVGVYSDSVYVRTLEGRPTIPPSGVVASAVSSTSVQLSWMPPNPQHINGINQGYRIDIRQSSNNTVPPVRVTVPSNTSNMLGIQTTYLTGLLKYTNYSITILCFTSTGEGPKTSPIKVMTLQDGMLICFHISLSQISSETNCI